MFGDGGDEVRRRTRVRCDDESWVGLSIRQYRVDATRAKQLFAGAQRENRLAVAVLVLDEFERPAVGAERAGGFVAVGEHQRVVEHGRSRLQADVHLDGLPRSWLHGTEGRRDEPRDRTFARQPIGDGHERRAVTPVRYENRHSTSPDAAVAGSCKQ